MRNAIALVLITILGAGVAPGLLAAPRQALDNGVVQVAPVGQAGAWQGFRVTAGEATVAEVMLGSSGALTARTVARKGEWLTFGGLRFGAGATLGGSSRVEVRLLEGDPYPEVRFRFDLQRFDAAAWAKAYGEVPFHFLACSVAGAQVFNQRGWAIGTPVVDDYIQMKAEGPGRTIVSEWSRDWMYAPPIGAYPTAAAGLWNPSNGRWVSYDFHGARLTDHTERDFGTTYCWKQQESREFFCMTWPYGKGYINLRYPTAPASFGTHFRLLWAANVGPADDPNRLVHEFIWRAYADKLPAAERMSDLSWLPGNLRLERSPVPGGIGGFVHNTGETGEIWWAPKVNILGGVSYFSPVDYCYETGNTAATGTLAKECRNAVTLGKWMEIEGDRCYWWQTPLDGGGAAMFGPGVETFHHVSGWGTALALLDYYRNDPAGAADLLGYIDGALRYTKHILYTRNCYPDVPAAQFAWSATPAVTFCLRYYYRFRGDAERGDLAELALKLARSMTYRYMALWPCDNDPADDLDSSFMMEPNAGLPWLGAACANEVWVYNISMLYEYLACGDPIMGHYLRGMLERYHEMYQDQWAPTVAQYPSSAFTERLGLYDEAPQPRGTRAGYGGLWGGFEQLIWPLGEATVRVACGEKAAMAFNRDGRHTDIADYRYYGAGRFSFKLVPGGLQADPKRVFTATVSFPFFDLRGKQVTVLRGAERRELGADEAVVSAADPSAVQVKGLMLGDMVCVGGWDAAAPILPCAVVKSREAWSDDERLVTQSGFTMVNLAPGATTGISRDWSDNGSLAGYEPGVKTLLGVPFMLQDPELTGNRVAISGEAMAYGQSPNRLFLLVGDVREKAKVTLWRPDGSKEEVDLGSRVPVVKGWPMVLGWHLDLVMVANGGKPIASIAPRGCKLFAVTGTGQGDAALRGTLAAIEAQRKVYEARRAAVAELVKLAPLFEAYSGHIAVMATPSLTNPRGAALMQMLQEAGLAKHVVLLGRSELADPAVFNTRNIWIAFYCGGEEYYQSVNRPNDAQELLQDWLRGGGTLVSLSNGPFPFYYNELGKPVHAAAQFGLPVCGSGAGERLDTLDGAPVAGWEKPEPGTKLHFELAPGQSVFGGLPGRIEWSAEGEQRWRPLWNVLEEGNTYTPLITLKDAAGKSYGEGAALLEYKTGPLAGARVLHVWNGLSQRRELTRPILVGVLQYLLSRQTRPLGVYRALPADEAPIIDGVLDDGIWARSEATEVFGLAGSEGPKAPVQRTVAKVAWDERNLYVAWDCQDPDIWGTMKERDAHIWDQEVVEVFIDPDGDGKAYREIEISPLNVVCDLNCSAAESSGYAPQDLEQALKWNCQGLRTAVKVRGTLDKRDDTDKGWTVEAAIPLAALIDGNPKPVIGSQWRVGLYRIDRNGTPPGLHMQSWSATEAFHNTARFGRLLFVGDVCNEDFADYAAGAAPTPTWQVEAGDWKVEDGELVGSDCLGNGFMPVGVAAGSADWTDYTLSVRFQIRERGSDHRDGAWIGLRHNGPGMGYGLDFEGGAVTLHKARDGVSTGDLNPLARVPWVSDGAWHEARIQLAGSLITVTLDGRPLLSVRDTGALGSDAIPSGGICLSARRWESATGRTTVAFDDVRVELAAR